MWNQSLCLCIHTLLGTRKEDTIISFKVIPFKKPVCIMRHERDAVRMREGAGYVPSIGGRQTIGRAPD